jgi:hypothetical protein
LGPLWRIMQTHRMTGNDYLQGYVIHSKDIENVQENFFVAENPKTTSFRDTGRECTFQKTGRQCKVHTVCLLPWPIRIEALVQLHYY